MSAPIRFDPARFLARFDALDRALIAASFPATSPWWRTTIERLFRSGRRQIVLRVGRRGGKSSTLCRVAVAWALWGSYSVPPGDIGVVAFVSVSRDESAQRLRTIEAILKVLEVPFRRSGDSIELEDRGVMFKTFTASISGVSGPTCIMVLGDELAKWKDADTGANPAREVIASLKPTVATQPNAPLFWSSSAFSKDDYHATLFDRGDQADQIVAWAPTWVANPSVSEEQTHELEPDHPTWSREYEAVPSDSAVENWFGLAIDRALDENPPPALLPGLRPIVAIDAAFVHDRFGFAVVASRAAGEVVNGRWVGEVDVGGRAKRITHTLEVGAWKPSGKPSEMAARLKAEVCSKWELEPRALSHVYGDQHEGSSFGELARNAGIRLEIVPWTAGSGDASKLAKFKAVRLAMLEGSFRIPNDPSLIREFRAVRGVLTASGAERIEIPRTAQGHGDRVSALCLAGSIALQYGANAPRLPPEHVDEMKAYKERLIAKRELQRLRNASRLSEYDYLRSVLRLGRQPVGSRA